MAVTVVRRSTENLADERGDALGMIRAPLRKNRLLSVLENFVLARINPFFEPVAPARLYAQRWAHELYYRQIVENRREFFQRGLAARPLIERRKGLDVIRDSCR